MGGARLASTRLPQQPATLRRMNIRTPALLLLCAGCLHLLGGCAAATPAAATASGAEIAANTLIIDTHIDVPYRLYRNAVDVSEATDSGDFDHPRAVRGGLNAPFMSIYIPAAVDEAGDAFNFAEQSIATVEHLAILNPDKFAVATCTMDLENHFAEGLISLPMGMENGGPIEGDLGNLQHFFERGIRYITLAHSRSNHISDSSYDDNEQWQGLSPFGRELIAEMNRLGVMIDVSHVSDNAFWQILETSAAPVLATHSSLRHFTPGFQRNMSDEMVKAMADKGGVIHINYGSAFVHEAAQAYNSQRTAAVRAYQSANHLADGDPALMQYAMQYTRDNPYPYATLDQVLDHIDRVVEIAGIDAVGIGSDYDGVGDTLPVGLKDAASYPNLIDGLLERGYSVEDITKILSGNALRVWRAVEAHAAEQGTNRQCRTT